MGKMVAPVLIMAAVLAWLGVYGVVILIIPGSGMWPMLAKGAGLILVLLLAGMTVQVLAERIREIREDEEDDHCQY